MTYIETLDSEGGALRWWCEFCVAHPPDPGTAWGSSSHLDDLLSEWRCFRGARGRLTFETEADATIFMLRWM